jgi:hypothetical protein
MIVLLVIVFVGRAMATIIKKLMILLLLGMLIPAASFAVNVAPAFSTRVHIIKNITPSQCPVTWRGNAQQANPTRMIPANMNGISTARPSSGFTSCTGCSYEAASHDCVCNACYGT